MIRLDEVLVLTPRITPTAAQVVALATWTTSERLRPPPELRGQIVGPLCEYADTLSDRIPLHPVVKPEEFSHDQVLATAQILEPCFWEPEHPFIYEVNLELWHEGKLADRRRIATGVRHLSVDRTQLLLNGQEYSLKGVWHASARSITELETWHELECNAFLTAVTVDLCARTDRWGPMVLHLLSPASGDHEVVQLRNHPSVLMWVLPAELTGGDLRKFIDSIRHCDPSRPIGQFVAIDQPARTASAADVMLLPASHPEIGNPESDKPYLVVGRFAGYTSDCTPLNFTDRVQDVRQALGEQPGLVGVIL